MLTAFDALPVVRDIESRSVRGRSQSHRRDQALLRSLRRRRWAPFQTAAAPQLGTDPGSLAQPAKAAPESTRVTTRLLSRAWPREGPARGRRLRPQRCGDTR